VWLEKEFLIFTLLESAFRFFFLPPHVKGYNLHAKNVCGQKKEVNENQHN